MSDFSFDRYRDVKRDPTPELSGGNLPALRPLDDALLSSVELLSAPNPSFGTLIGVLDRMGLSAPTRQLQELWKWLMTEPHHRDLVQFPTDRVLMELAGRLDAQISLFREANYSQVGYTFLIQPRDPQFCGMALSFTNRINSPASQKAVHSSELQIQPLPTIGPESQIVALREALRLLGVTRAAQVERNGSSNFGRPSADIGLDRVNFERQRGFFLADLGEEYRIGRMTKCIMYEGIGKEDFVFLLKLGRQEFTDKTLPKLWDGWLVARPHSTERAVVITDLDLRSAALQVGGSVGLIREATAEGVSYGLQATLLSDRLNGMRVTILSPSREPQFNGGESHDGGSDRMLMRVLGAPGILSASRVQTMTRIMQALVPDFRPAPEEELPEVIDLGKSRILCSSNVRLFLNRNG